MVRIRMKEFCLLALVVSVMMGRSAGLAIPTSPQRTILENAMGLTEIVGTGLAPVLMSADFKQVLERISSGSNGTFYVRAT